MAGHNQDRALRITDDVFCDTPDQRVLQTGAAVSGSDHEINVGFTGRRADFIHRGTRQNFRLDWDTAQKIHLL